MDRIRWEMNQIGPAQGWRRVPGLRLESLAQDVRHASRMLRKRPGSTGVILATLALGMGTSIMIYDAGRALATEAVPFSQPERLVTVDVRGTRGVDLDPSYADFRIWESGADPLLTLGAYTSRDHFVSDGTRTFRVPGSRVAGDFFSVLAIDPLLGRLLSPEQVAPGEGRVTVITQRLWERRFGADPEIIGSPIRIDGRLHTVVGVVASGLQFPAGADLWTPVDATADDAASLRLNVIGRLEPGAARQKAQTALATIQRGLDMERPAQERAQTLTVLPLTGRPSGSDSTALLLLQCTVLVLLLIASANAAGLMLTKAIERRQEIAIRASLGASRGRVLRQLLVESTLLALVSGALGLLVADVGIAALRSALPAAMTRHMLGWERFGLDAQTAAFALVLAALTGIAFGMIPALRAVRGDLTAHLREDAPTATGGRRGSRIARMVLSGEVALALTLLLTAGLLTRSLLGVLAADPGFNAEGVLTVEWALPPEAYDRQDAIPRFQAPLLARLRGMPGVRSAALVSNRPMGGTWSSKAYRVQGSAPDAEAQSASWRSITPRYLSTLGIPLREGRHFARTDGSAGPRVAILSEAMARRHWPEGLDALGRTLEVEGEAWTVVGVAEDVYDYGVQRPAIPTIYVPQAQSPSRAGFLAVRVAGDPAVLAPRVRQEIWRIDPDIALGETQTLPRMVETFYADERVMALLMAVFAAISLLITVVSLYTLVAHFVARRRHEIGIRLALGAGPRRIVIDAMSQGILSVGVGIAVGLALAAAAAQALGAMLYGIGPLDPVVFVLVPGGLLAVAVLASYVPALGATAVDPAEVLGGG